MLLNFFCTLFNIICVEFFPGSEGKGKELAKADKDIDTAEGQKQVS